MDLHSNDLISAVQLAAMPDPDYTITEWADRYRVLPGVSAAEPGKYRSSRTPFFVEVMDALSNNSGVEYVCLMKGVQIGGTEVGNNWFGYVVDVAPGPMMMIFPTGDLGRDHSKQKLAPTIEETPPLRAKISEAKSRDSGNTISVKEFPGGILYIYGSNTPTSFRSRTIRYLFLDDIDGFPGDVRGEGDPVQLARKRTDTFGIRRKIYEVSTPTIKGQSRIEQAFLESDQRYNHMPCPHCGKFQALEWGGKDADFGIKFVRGEEADRLEYVYYQCKHCKDMIEERHKGFMLPGGRWIATKPERDKRGYHLSGLYSPLGWVSWWEIVQEFLDAQGNLEAMKVWTNTRLALTWEVRGQQDEGALHKLCDDRPEGLVPSEGVLGLTMGIDTHDNGFYYVIRAWGRDMESWLINYGFIDTFPALADLIYKTRYRDSEDHEYPVMFALQDAMGHRTKEVYEFARRKKGILPTQGVISMASLFRLTKIDTWPGTNKPIPGGVQLLRVNTTVYKNHLSNKMAPGDGEPATFHLHAQISREYIGHMTAEYVDEKTGRWECPKWRANDYWDCEVLAYVAADYIGLQYRNKEPVKTGAVKEKKKSGWMAQGKRKGGWLK